MTSYPRKYLAINNLDLSFQRLDRFQMLVAQYKHLNLKKDKKFTEVESKALLLAKNIGINKHEISTINYTLHYVNQASRIGECFMYLGSRLMHYLFAQVSKDSLGSDTVDEYKAECLKEIKRLLVELNLNNSVDFINTSIFVSGDYNPDEAASHITGEIRNNYRF